MKKNTIRLGWLLPGILVLVLSACSAPVGKAADGQTSPASTNTPKAESYSDPFAYCAAVGTVDTPDGRYSGEQVPEAVINGFKKAAGLEASTEPMDMFKKTTIWRCMENRVYACNFGANLPCSSKANTDKTPSQAMTDYCAANPDSDIIPMSVTGHSTIYSWHCVKDAPELLDQVENVDAAGYLEQIWYAIEPNVPASVPPTETAAPATATGKTIQPLTVEVCDGEAQAMAHALDVLEVTQSNVPMDDYLTNASGTGCMTTVTGNGVKFKGPDTVLKALAGMLVDEGWTEDTKLAAGGPTGISAGYRKDNQLSLVTAMWEPDASANCPQDQPISACTVKPEQQNYTITLTFGVENP